MTLVQSIDKVVAWLNENVCSQITLKLPDDYKNGTGYDVEFVHPAAFPLYVPGKDRLPPSVPAPIPSVCVQLTEGSDDLLKKQRQREELPRELRRKELLPKREPPREKPAKINLQQNRLLPRRQLRRKLRL
jgi:hypothetical protein